MAQSVDFDRLWDYNDPAATEIRFRELLPEARQGDPDIYLQLMTQIARTHSLRHQFSEAHNLLDSVEQQLSERTIIARVRYLLERGRTHNSAGEREQARPLFINAWELARQHHAHFHAVDAAHMMGIAADPAEQLDWNLKALDYAETADDERAQQWLGSLYNNIGWTYHDRGEYEKALELFQNALNWRIQQGKEIPIRIARWCVGRCLRSLNRITEALSIQRELESGEHDGYVDEEIAECLLLLGDNETARPYFKAAYEKLSQDQWLQQNEGDRLERLKEMAKGQN